MVRLRGQQWRMRQDEDQCGRNGRRRGTPQSNAEEKGADRKKENQKGHKETEKERKDTVNIHRRTQGERSHDVLLQNPGKQSYLGSGRFIHLKSAKGVRSIVSASIPRPRALLLSILSLIRAAMPITVTLSLLTSWQCICAKIQIFFFKDRRDRQHYLYGFWRRRRRNTQYICIYCRRL